MINHLRQGLQIADYAIPRATTADLQQFIANFKAREQAEMDYLNGWLMDWYQMQPPALTQSGDDDEGGLRELNRLTTSRFDIELLEMIGEYDSHESSMARTLTRRARHADLKTFSQIMIETDRAEIRQVEAWIKTLKQAVQGTESHDDDEHNSDYDQERDARRRRD
ncbi:MAG: DUF305 domain-containing protein [bacterium]|nr:DUF305 domain-containing protein [bacterium]